jgi:hypothetical protein
MGQPETIRFGPSPKETRVLRVSLAWLCALVVITLVLAGHRADWTLLLEAGFWGFLAGLTYLALRPDRIYLELSPDGFIERQVLVRRTRLWKDWDGFVAEKGPEGELVAFRRVEVDRGGLLSRLGRSGRLTGTYGMKAEELADRLNAWRQRYGPKPGAKAELIDDWI